MRFPKSLPNVRDLPPVIRSPRPRPPSHIKRSWCLSQPEVQHSTNLSLPDDFAVKKPPPTRSATTKETLCGYLQCFSWPLPRLVAPSLGSFYSATSVILACEPLRHAGDAYVGGDLDRRGDKVTNETNRDYASETTIGRYILATAMHYSSTSRLLGLHRED